MHIIQAEYLKYKKTFMSRLILLAPLFFILVAIPQKLFMPPDSVGEWRLMIAMVYNWWPVIFIPFGTALFAALVAVQEKKAGNYKTLRTHNISPARIWIGKIIVMSIRSLLTTIVLIGVLILLGFMTAGGDIPWYEIFVGGFILWFTSLAIIPVQLWIATWKGSFASMCMGVLGFIVGVTAATKHYWIYVPWSWPTRMMSPIIGVHPNGTFLTATDPLRNAAVVPVGIMISFMAVILFTIATAIWFHQWEVR